MARRSRGSYEAPVAAAASASSRPNSSIPTERVTEIQNALIKAGYMEGPASGQYDDATIAAMKQFQADNGFSQTGLPSAALLKKLGVSKRPNDGYAVSVTKAASESEKKRPQQ
ncbi:MAG TPA: peptidoglycan-binding domain-containing protein [Blastocatellia bacterium]|nr:peptidoglycan-binding domain-containing protein [Blastocatellia bacterium]